MSINPTIIKSSGEQQDFSLDKLIKSIQSAGAGADFAAEIAKAVLDSPVVINSTTDLHREVFNFLKQNYAPLAARYNMREAIDKLGPTGFPFESFVAEIFKRMGYEAQTRVIMRGTCVSHEVDVVLKNEAEFNIVECKFHNEKWVKSDLKVPLYIKSRFDDIYEHEVNTEKAGNLKYSAWIVTNTEFTSEAFVYALCKNIRLISWTKPEGGSLLDLVNKMGVHPVTTLTFLNDKAKELLMNAGIVLCQDVKNGRKVLKQAGLSDEDIEKAIKEAEAVVLMKNSVEVFEEKVGTASK